MFNFLSSDRNTTIAGLLAFIALIAGQLLYQFDTDPSTNPDWSLIVTGLFTFIGLLKAKDAVFSKEK